MSEKIANAGLVRIVELHRVTQALIARMTEYQMPERIVLFDEMANGIWTITEASTSFQAVPPEAVRAMGMANVGLGLRGDNHFYTLKKDGSLR